MGEGDRGIRHGVAGDGGQQQAGHLVTSSTPQPASSRTTREAHRRPKSANTTITPKGHDRGLPGQAVSAPVGPSLGQPGEYRDRSRRIDDDEQRDENIQEELRHTLPDQGSYLNAQRVFNIYGPHGPAAPR